VTEAAVIAGAVGDTVIPVGVGLDGCSPGRVGPAALDLGERGQQPTGQAARRLRPRRGLLAQGEG